MPEPMIDTFELRRALGAFVTGVTVVATLDDNGNPRGFTANSFTSVSLNPPLILVCLAKGGANYPVFAASRHFAVNILTEKQREISHVFASKIPDRFARVDWRSGTTGSPLLSDSAAWFDCRMHQTIDAGDHIILIGRIIEFGHSTANPLGYCRGSYLTFGLEQAALAAPGQQTRVGAILEYNKRILLLEDPDSGLLHLPTGASLRRAAAADSLPGTIKALGVEADIEFLFAVFEDERSDILWVYYRGEIVAAAQIAVHAHLIEFDAIPWDRLPDRRVCSMLQRYVNERREDQFGVYVGGPQGLRFRS